MTTELDLVYALRSKRKAQNTKGRGKGCFGGKNRFLGNYTTLHVVRKSERTAENCNKNGVAI